jgi:methyl-accepting chemotaxis protein
MIKDLVAIINLYRDKLGLIVLILAMPWAWAAFWVPWWVNVACILMVPIAGLLLIFRVLPLPDEPRREGDDSNMSDANIRKMRKMSSGIHNLLSRWATVSSQSRSSIEEVTTHVDEVISYSENSVVEVSKNFINVTRKTRMQVEHALGLLERTRGGADGSGARSLPELVTAYEAMLRQVADSLARIADTAHQLEKRHEAVRENLKHIDTLLDQLSAHDSQIGMLALNTSVAAGGGANFVSVSDQIRTISLESKALTRDIRRTLEEVRGQSQETHGAVRAAVQQARDAAHFASDESGKLKSGMLENSRALEQTLAQIGSLGNEIQSDINNIIVALQFQDITQQKLQRLKHPMLTDLTTSLRAIFDETRVLSSKLQVSGMVERQAGSGSFRVSRSADQPDMPEQLAPEPPPPAPAEGSGKQKPKGDEAVEIF